MFGWARNSFVFCIGHVAATQKCVGAGIQEAEEENLFSCRPRNLRIPNNILEGAGCIILQSYQHLLRREEGKISPCRMLNVRSNNVRDRHYPLPQESIPLDKFCIIKISSGFLRSRKTRSYEAREGTMVRKKIQCCNPCARISNPFARFSNPFAQIRNPFPRIRNPFARISNPFARFSNPFARFRNPFARFSNPFAQIRNPFARFSNPFAQIRNPFARIMNPFARFSKGMSNVRWRSRATELGLVVLIVNALVSLLVGDSTDSIEIVVSLLQLLPLPSAILNQLTFDHV